jgi:hypothetical protein
MKPPPLNDNSKEGIANLPFYLITTLGKHVAQNQNRIKSKSTEIDIIDIYHNLGMNTWTMEE